MKILTTEKFKKNLSIINKRIENACNRVERNPHEIRLLTVTKSFPKSYILIAREGGINLFGENRIQEALGKFDDLKDTIELHLIGHLQRNKAKIAVNFFHTVQSIDKDSTAEILNKYAGQAGKIIDVLIEINTSQEETKYGLTDDKSYYTLLEKILNYKNLKLRGLMTVGPFTTDEKRIRSAFAKLRNLFWLTKKRYTIKYFDTLSMGMSSDFEIAIEEGSTMIRIGSALLDIETTNYMYSRIAWILIIIFLVAVVSFTDENKNNNTDKKEAAPYTEAEFPLWLRDLRRAEIIFIGSIPFTFFLAFEVFDTYRFVTHDFQSEYSPWPIKGPVESPYTSEEKLVVTVTAISLSIIIAIVDHIIIRILRDKKTVKD